MAVATFVCETCGQQFSRHVYPSRLKRNGFRFCGPRCNGAQFRTHGHYKSRLYQIWRDMRNRCYLPRLRCYPDYGGRGIRVCDEWHHSFQAFAEWAYRNGYQDSLTIDRKATNGDYKPDNCRWVTQSVQSQNTRKRRSGKTSQYKGVSRSHRRWWARLNKDSVCVLNAFFATEIEAAHAYDAAARRFFGEECAVNFPTVEDREMGAVA